MLEFFLTELLINFQIATSDYNFFIITGPNMSGKTVYIKMIAILQVMAQVMPFYAFYLKVRGFFSPLQRMSTQFD